MATDFEAARGSINALKLRIEIAKMGMWDGQKHPRYPKNDPHGGQFAPKRGALGSWLADFFGYNQTLDLADSGYWQAKQPAVPWHTVERKGSVKHPFPDNMGREAFIHRPNTPTAADSPAWANPDEVVTVTPGSKTPASLNGVKFEPAPEPENWQTVAGQNPQVEEGLPDLESIKGMHPAAGVIVQEPDGRVWLTKPLNGYGGYKHTYPKGTQEHGLTLQQTAIKEAWEETGLKVEIVGVLGDFRRTSSVARYYVAKRVGGSPSAQGWESQAMRLVPPSKISSFLNMPVDRDIWQAYTGEHQVSKAREAFIDLSALDRLQERIDALLRVEKSSFDDTKHPRWPKGSPLGGQFMSTDSAGIITPPTVGSASNPSWQKKVNAAYDAAKAGDAEGLAKLEADLQGKVAKYGYTPGASPESAYGAGPHSQAKWAQQAHQYVAKLQDEQKSALVAKLEAPVAGAKGDSPPPLTLYKKIEAKPGGSNPGAVYEGPDGKKYLVKGANYPSDDRAKNEVLASKLMNAAGAKAPNMHLVDLGKQYGGGLGVAAEMEPITGKWSNTPGQRAAAQSDFAVHAWLANYDAAGTPAGDNLAFTGDGKLFNYDPGGALLYRAQGLPKAFPGGVLPTEASEWNTMRNKSFNAAAHSIYGDMTSTQLANAAEKLHAVDDKTISDLVAKYGPGTPEQKLKLAATLVARRDDILYNKAGLPHDGKVGVVNNPGGLNAIEPHYDANKVYDAVHAVKEPFLMKPASLEFVTKLKVAATTPGYANALQAIDAVQADIALGNHKLPMGGVSALNTYGSALKGAIKVTQASTAGGKITGVDLASDAWGKPGDNIGLTGKADLKDAKAHIMAHLTNHGFGDGPGQLNVYGAAGLHKAITQAKTVEDISDTVNSLKDWKPTSPELMAAKKSLLAATEHTTVSMNMGAAKLDPIKPPTKADFLKAGSSDVVAHNWASTMDGMAKAGPNSESWAKNKRGYSDMLTGSGIYTTNPAEPSTKANAKLALDWMANVEGKDPVSYGGSNYQAANEARHNAALAHGKFGPGNPPGAQDFYTMDENGKAVPSPYENHPHGADVNEITGAYQNGDKAKLTGLFTKFDDAAKTGQNPFMGGQMNEAGINNSAVKAAYAKGLLDDLRGKKSWTGDIPTKEDFTAALGHTGTVPEVYASIVQKLDHEGVGSETWSANKLQMEGIAGQTTWLGKPGTHPNKPAADLMLKWMQEKEAFAGAEAEAFGAGGLTPQAHAMQIVQDLHSELKTGVLSPALNGPISSKVVQAVEAFHSGDDKAMASAMGAIGMTGDTMSEPAYEKLHKLALTKADQFPLSTGGATAHDAAEHPKPSSVSDASFGPGKVPHAGDFLKAGGKPETVADWGKSATTYKQWHEWAKGGDAHYLENLKTTLGLYDKAATDGPSQVMHGYLKNLVNDVEGGSVAASVMKPPAPPIPNFQATTKSAVAYYEGVAKKMQDAYAAGDMEALSKASIKPSGKTVWPVYETGANAGLPKTMNGKLLAAHQQILLDQLNQHNALSMQADLAKPVGKIPDPGENIGSNPAMPNFDRAQISTINTNAGSHNAKVHQIKVLAQKGDVKGLLALNYGTNTYGKKQAKLANDALKALGSDLKVTPGQKKNSHPAISLAGAEQQFTHTPTGKKIDPALTDKELPPKIDFSNYNGTGKGLSSKPAVNIANQQAYDHLIDLAKKGDVKGIKSATFQPIDAATGAAVGGLKPISEHPSQHIKNLQDSLLQTMDEKLHPPEPLKFFSGKAFNSVAEASAAVPPRPYGTTAAKHPTSQTIGYYLALGQVTDPTNLAPAKTFDVPPEAKAKASSDYAKMNSDAKKFVNIIQGGGGHPWKNPNSAHGGYSASQLESMAVAAHKYAHELPAGSTIYKWDNLTPDMKQKLALSQPGLIVQNPAPVCCSYSPTSTKSFGSSHRFKIIMAPGAKVVSSFSSGSYSSEGEFTLLPNHRFLILSHQKHTAGGYAETTVLLMPPDPALEAKAKKLLY